MTTPTDDHNGIQDELQSASVGRRADPERETQPRPRLVRQDLSSRFVEISLTDSNAVGLTDLFMTVRTDELNGNGERIERTRSLTGLTVEDLRQLHGHIELRLMQFGG